MNIEIDQSGKVENTNRDTVIGFSNGISKSLIISSNDKKKLQEIFREAGKRRIFIYRIFAILIFILIKDYLSKIEEIIIDEEYPGKASLIKNYLYQEVRKIKPNFSAKNIVFRRIGKKSRAHNISYLTFKENKRADVKLRIKDILKFIVK